ncbi:MAG TPA: hypothetical protein VEL31_11775 [Ktedonobacteraceae bacterium]|nr:hypothetical protein [Ktedonobacteraceae bacterium]
MGEWNQRTIGKKFLVQRALERTMETVHNSITIRYKQNSTIEQPLSFEVLVTAVLSGHQVQWTRRPFKNRC